MNLVTEFLSWLNRGVLLSNLKASLAPSQPGTLAPVDQTRHSDILYQGKNMDTLYNKEKKTQEKHTNNNRAGIKDTHLPSNWGRIVKRKFQRLLIVFSCGPDGGTLRTAVGRDDGVRKLNKKLSPRHMILDIQTELPPPTVCPKQILLEFCVCKKKETTFDRNCSTAIHCGIPELIY